MESRHYWTLIIISLLGFLLLSWGYIEMAPWFIQVDEWGMELYTLSHRIKFLTEPFKWLTYIGNKEPLIVLGVITIGVSFVCFRKKFALIYLLCTITSHEMFLYLKGVFLRPRPSLVHLIYAQGYSFPSGHATKPMVFYGLLAYLISVTSINKWTRKIVLILLILLPLLIGFSRVILGVHYLTDILAGFFLGVFISSAGVLLYEELDVSHSYEKKRSQGTN